MFRRSLALAILLHQPAVALQSGAGQHVEIHHEYQPAAGTWQWTAELGDQVVPSESVFFGGVDATGGTGVRVTRAADPKWDFIGVAAGQIYWRFRDLFVGTPGFANTQEILAGNPLTFRLHSVQGPAGGLFSAYSSNMDPIIHFRTDDGIDSTDVFQKPDQHTHLNWAFTKRGLWIIYLTVQGTISSSNTLTPVSPPQPHVFAIGDHAIWRATHFNVAQLQDGAVSGDLADPDGDGINNLTEYALGGHPWIASSTRTEDGAPLAPQLLPPTSTGAPWRLSYFRKKPSIATQLTYQVESSTALGSGDWEIETGILGVFPSLTAWEQVSIPLSKKPENSSTGFFRLKIETLP